MVSEINVRVLPKVASSEQFLKDFVSKEYSYDVKNITAVQVVKRTIDARQRTVFVNLQFRSPAAAVIARQRCVLVDFVCKTVRRIAYRYRIGGCARVRGLVRRQR